MRSIQTIGYLHKTFDFDQKEIVQATKVNINIKEETYEKLLSLVPIEMLDLQTNVLASLGHLMVQDTVRHCLKGVAQPYLSQWDSF